MNLTRRECVEQLLGGSLAVGLGVARSHPQKPGEPIIAVMECDSNLTRQQAEMIHEQWKRDVEPLLGKKLPLIILIPGMRFRIETDYLQAEPL